jgi:hypothetical protein
MSGAYSGQRTEIFSVQLGGVARIGPSVEPRLPIDPGLTALVGSPPEAGIVVKDHVQ